MIRELSWADYTALDAINPSLVTYGDQLSMLHMLYEKEDSSPPTEAMVIGTLTHMMVFEAGRFAETVSVFADGSKLTKAWKEHKATAEAAGKIPLHADDLEEIQEMADAVADSRTCSAMVGMKGITEACLTWTDEESGVACKSRLDRYIPDGNVVLEFKTAVRGSPRALRRVIRENGWDIAAAMRVDAITKITGKCLEYWWIVVEKKPPKDKDAKVRRPVVTPYRCDAGYLALGRAKYKPVLAKWAQCLKTGYYPAYAEKGGLLLTPDAWELKQFEVEYTNGGES